MNRVLFNGKMMGMLAVLRNCKYTLEEKDADPHCFDRKCPYANM